MGAAPFLLAASLLASEPQWQWAGIALLAAAILRAPALRFPVNGLSVSVTMLCAWLFVDAALLTPHYSALGLYRPVILFLGFVTGTLLTRAMLKHAFVGGAALVSGLVLFGLMQVLLGFHAYEDAARAAATFATPNTFADAINLFLLPLLALLLSRRAGTAAAIAALWLFAGLMSTGSRGGWIAFAAGIVFIAAFKGESEGKQGGSRWGVMLGASCAIIVGYYAIKAALPGQAVPSVVGLLTQDVAARGSSYRLDLAQVALDQIAQRPLAGHGANMFWPLYEMTKPSEVDLGVTYEFTHNDYLQTWVEFGIVGIVLLCAVVYASYALILRQRKAGSDPLPLCAGAAATALFVHSLVDFPLYIPFLLAVLGLWLGAVASLAGDAPRLDKVAAFLAGHARRTRFAAVAATVCALAWLSQPVLAEVASRRALSELYSGHAGQGLYWQVVARRLEPQSGRRYWEEGVVLREQAIASSSRALAARADAAFAEGARLDPYDAENFVERARLHRQNRDLLDSPASARDILEWASRAAALRPYMLKAQAEYARALAYAGRRDEALVVARRMLKQHPNSSLAARFIKEL